MTGIDRLYNIFQPPNFVKHNMAYLNSFNIDTISYNLYVNLKLTTFHGHVITNSNYVIKGHKIIMF